MWFVVVGHVASHSSDKVAGSGHTDSHIVLGFSSPFDCDAVFVSDDVHLSPMKDWGKLSSPVTEAYWLSIFSFDDFNDACVADDVYFAAW